MITTFYYATSTLATPEKCLHRNRGNAACKHAEFINVWYDYVRHIYGPSEHIYIVDNASPIPFQEAFDMSKEAVEFLEPDQYTYNPNVFIHVKRFNEHLNHGGGVVRAVWEGFKFSLANKQNYYFTEADSLSLVNLHEELENADIVTSNIEHGSEGCIDCSNWAFRYELLTDYKMNVPSCYGYQTLSVFDALNESIEVNGICSTQPNNQYYGCIEHGPYANYHGKCVMKQIPKKWIHDCDEQRLIEFINITNPLIKSSAAQNYAQRL